jgi:hypothetical protein
MENYNMTLDVTIGKLTFPDPQTIINEILTTNESPIVEEYQFIYVTQCPNSEIDICDPAVTLWPKESYRSGSTHFWIFFERLIGIDIYHAMRNYPNSNERDIALIKPLINEINKLNTITRDQIIEMFPELSKDQTNIDGMVDRLKWFIYWTNKAVELYDDFAAIDFT